MTATSFNALEVARELKAAGIESGQAEVLAEAMRKAAGADRDELATRADIAAMKTDMAAMESRICSTLYRALLIQGGAVVAVLAALKLVT